MKSSNTRCGKCLYATKRVVIDTSLGKHYTVFHHNRRSYYSTLCCGLLTLLLYALVFYYAFARFYSVAMRVDFDIVEEFRPLQLSNYSLSVGKFLDTSNLNIQFIMPYPNSFAPVFDYCSKYKDSITLTASNPEAKLNFQLEDIIDYYNIEYKCKISFQRDDKLYQSVLANNFTIYFSCSACASEYQVSMEQYFVNNEGLYSHQYTTQENSKFRQKNVQLIPIIVSTTDDVWGFADYQEKDIKISALSTVQSSKDIEQQPYVTIYFGDSEVFIT